MAWKRSREQLNCGLTFTILDLNLPRMNGIELPSASGKCQRLTAIVFLSENSDARIKQ